MNFEGDFINKKNLEKVKKRRRPHHKVHEEKKLQKRKGNGDECTARDNIRVLVRIRPKNSREKKQKEARTVVKALDSQNVIFDPKQEAVEFFFHGVKQKVYDYKERPNKNLRFGFDHVFAPSHSNVEIFDNALKSLVSHVIRGFNCSVFAYGATGSGKTYTMLGSAENPGLTFLMAKELSKRIKEMANEFESETSVSYLEVYNETIKDLLYPSGQLSIREDELNGVNVPNLTLHKINDTCDLLRMLSHGNNARTQHPTDQNSESSRSHAVFQVFVTLRKRITNLSLNYKMVKAKLVMVDLAGSERGACTSNSDCYRAREGGNINKSLLALGNCINALADGKKHIPYRDSKLTRLLKDSLGGNCKTVMIANVSPTALTYDDTYNTLKYADRAKNIRVIVAKNVILEPNYEHFGKAIGALQSEILNLKALLQRERETNITLRDQQNVEPAGRLSPNTSFVSVPPVIHNPAALENLIQLLGQKKKLEEAHVEASVRAKGSEWRMLWQKWRLGSLTVLSKADNERKQSSIQKLRSQYENLCAEHEQDLEKVQLSKRLLDFNEKEIDLIGKTFLSTLNKNDPFLTVTLREFLYYKTLEREVGTHKCIENFHQQMCSGMFDELLRTEIILSDNLKLSQHLYRMLEKNNIPFSDTQYKDIVAQIYGEKDLEIGKRKTTFPTVDSIQDMLEMISSPIVEYERSETGIDRNANQPDPLLPNFRPNSEKRENSPLSGSSSHEEWSEPKNCENVSDIRSNSTRSEMSSAKIPPASDGIESDEEISESTKYSVTRSASQDSCISCESSIARVDESEQNEHCSCQTSEASSRSEAKRHLQAPQLTDCEKDSGLEKQQETHDSIFRSSGEEKLHRENYIQNPISLLEKMERNGKTLGNYSTLFWNQEQDILSPSKDSKLVTMLQTRKPVLTRKPEPVASLQENPNIRPQNSKLSPHQRSKSRDNRIGNGTWNKTLSELKESRKHSNYTDPGISSPFSKSPTKLRGERIEMKVSRKSSAVIKSPKKDHQKESVLQKVSEPRSNKAETGYIVRKSKIVDPKKRKPRRGRHGNLQETKSSGVMLKKSTKLMPKSCEGNPNGAQFQKTSKVKPQPSPGDLVKCDHPNDNFHSVQMFTKNLPAVSPAAKPSPKPPKIQNPALNSSLNSAIRKAHSIILSEIHCSKKSANLLAKMEALAKESGFPSKALTNNCNNPENSKSENSTQAENPDKEETTYDFHRDVMIFLPSPEDSNNSADEPRLIDANMNSQSLTFPREDAIEKQTDLHYSSLKHSRDGGRVGVLPTSRHLKEDKGVISTSSRARNSEQVQKRVQNGRKKNKPKVNPPSLTNSLEMGPGLDEPSLKNAEKLKRKAERFVKLRDSELKYRVGGEGDVQNRDHRLRDHEVKESNNSIVKPPPGYEQELDAAYVARLLSLAEGSARS